MPPAELQMTPSPAANRRFIRRMSWITVAAAIVITLVVVLRSLFATDPLPSAVATPPPDVEALAEQPGGFDPVPQFGALRRELEFRGTECLTEGDSEAGAYRLYGSCRSE
jgi:hypothetical protein